MNRQWVWRILLVSAVLHVIAAFSSQGFHSADEYFQILEFAGFKLGFTPQVDLAVEFGERMRPWFLPGIVTACVRFFEWVGLHNPHHWAIGLRLLSGAIGWMATAAMAFSAPVVLRSARLQKFAVLASAFLWFVPALHVRPSSEAWSGAWIAIGWALIVIEMARKPPHLRTWVGLLAGVAAGFSFESRFQAGVMIAPFAILLAARLWRKSARFFAAITLGFVLVFALGRWMDAWGYGEWCFSPLNYLHFNLVRGEVNKFGTSPFWDVFRMATTEAWPLLGLLVVASWCVAWVRRPWSLLTAVTAPLFIVHCVIAHKELRFFFPIAYFTPLLLSVASEGWWERAARNRFLRILFWMLVIWNGIGLVASSLLPMSRNVLFFREIWDREITEVGTFDQDPFEILASNTYFYRPSSWHAQSIHDARELTQWLSQPRYLFRSSLELPDWVHALNDVRCDRVYAALPGFLIALRQKGFLPRANAWTLWSCHRLH